MSIADSKAKIERLLHECGTYQFMYGWEGNRAVIGFQIQQWQVKLFINLPDRDDEKFTRTPTGKSRAPHLVIAEWEKACWYRWNEMACLIESKLHAIDSGLRSFEQEFLADIVSHEGGTVGSHMLPQIKRIYNTEQVPSLLPDLSEK